MKRLCRAQRQWGAETLECDRKYLHRKLHRARWRDGKGSRWYQITVKWAVRR